MMKRMGYCTEGMGTTTEHDIECYHSIKRLCEALDTCDLAFLSGNVLNEILGGQQRAEFKKIWDKAYDELSQILDEAKASALRNCLKTELSHADVLAIVNGWLDDERYACDLPEDE